MTIHTVDSGAPFQPQLEEDGFTMLWLQDANSRGERRGKYLLCSRAQDWVAYRARITRNARVR